MAREPSMTSMTRFSKLAVATAITTVALFSVGGLVRGSGSGLGCPTWPQCEPGQLVPVGHDPLADRVLPSRAGVRRHRADRALRHRGDRSHQQTRASCGQRCSRSLWW